MEPDTNDLPAALSQDVQRRIIQHLDLMPQALGEVLYESGDSLCNVYWSIDIIVSLLYAM